MLEFTEDERSAARAELATIGITQRFAPDSDNAAALLGYVALMLKFLLVVRPDLSSPTLRLSLAMYAVWKADDFTTDAVEPVTAVPAPLDRRVPGECLGFDMDCGRPLPCLDHPQMQPLACYNIWHSAPVGPSCPTCGVGHAPAVTAVLPVPPEWPPADGYTVPTTGDLERMAQQLRGGV